MEKPSKELPLPGEVFSVKGCTAFPYSAGTSRRRRQDAVGLVRTDAAGLAGSGREVDV